MEVYLLMCMLTQSRGYFGHSFLKYCLDVCYPLISFKIFRRFFMHVTTVLGVNDTKFFIISLTTVLGVTVLGVALG